MGALLGTTALGSDNLDKISTALGVGANPYGMGAAPLQNPISTGDVSSAQTDVNSALAKQRAFLQQLRAQNGIQNQSNVFNQLQGVANGQGPNPAQAMLDQATGNNIASQAALMAGQRGAGANAGLIARQAAQQGGNLQQQAAGQGAVLQANQSLGALNQLGGIAGQQVGQQANATMGLNQAAQGNQQQVLNAINAQNQNKVSQQNTLNNANAGLANTRLQGQQGIISGVMGGVGTAVGLAQGGEVPAPMAISMPANPSGPQSNVAKFHMYGPSQPMMLSQGGKVPAMVSPGEVYVKPQDVQAVAQKKALATEAGEKIPGKAKVKGDSLKNDVVSKDLDAGGVVIPRSIMESKDAASKAAKFVAAVLAKKGKLPQKGR